jgi:Protein of unknown function (DUF3887)
MNKTRFSLITSLLLILSILATGCGPANPADLTNDEIIAITKNILTALDNGNYAAFSRDFSDEMKNALPEDQFNKLGDMLHKFSGKFISTGNLSLSNNQDFALYQIICKYEHEDVVVTIVFRIKGKLVEGLYFDSPYLRATPSTTSTPTPTAVTPQP